MMMLDDAVQLIMENVAIMSAETRPLSQCLGYVLAEDIYSPLTLPMAPTGMPDGYALRAEDVAEATADNPVALHIRGTSRAGCPARKALKPKSAIRIMTGAVLPKGADCVIRFEDTDEPTDKNGPNLNKPKKVKIFKSAKVGEGIRPEGSAIKEGDLLLAKGTLIAPHQISALASIGLTQVRVIRRPVIAIIPTGDELMQPGRPLTVGKVYNSNGPAIVAYVQQYGGIAKPLGIARDKEGSLEAKLERALDVDAIITSGGVSKGDYDLVRLVLAKHGHIVFSRVKMGPGASVAFAILKRPVAQTGRSVSIPVFSLSGPPVGCLVNLETLLRPALLKMRGLSQLEHPTIAAAVSKDIPKRMPFPFARWSKLQTSDTGYSVDLNMGAPMGDLASVANANAITVVPGNSPLQAGDTIEVLPFDGWLNQ
ncbi:molybdopterin molybdotransferase MoeA [Desulfobulbus rhabdoformis]|uniref:molybdopterin molybdotransferase MoeA n=1 Tax=Desulfobulbus rhabdoformis TaxID=34032 RepID=UPI0019651B53|nr:gephyrin-like molybdotransferase Glp [Desulfobulbus rhabdoformis]MBM9612872.1 molybdopterin molybdotransferase MoeA [Desulfobulbus rhabdoformis]